MADPTPYARTVDQVAQHWSCSSRHVYALIARGELGHIRVGTLIRVRQADLDLYEARQWHAPDSIALTSGSSSEVTAITSAGGRMAGGNAFQRGQAIAARRAGS